MLQNQLSEVLDRTRRIETRLTKYMQAQGIDAGSLKPMWRNGKVHAPNAMVGTLDLLNVIPDDWPQALVPVYVRGTLLCWVQKPTTL